MDIPDKNYFRIGEVGRILGVEPYVVRYWETEFKTVRPIRTKSDQRLYRRQDVKQLVEIKNLLYEEMFTIAGAKKRLARIKRDEEVSPSMNDRLVEIRKGLEEIRDIVS